MIELTQLQIILITALISGFQAIFLLFIEYGYFVPRLNNNRNNTSNIEESLTANGSIRNREASRLGFHLGGMLKITTILIVFFACVYILVAVGYEQRGIVGVIYGAAAGLILSILGGWAFYIGWNFIMRIASIIAFGLITLESK